MNDLRFAFRQLLKNPGFTLVTVAALAVSIGATTTVFALINAVYLKPLPVNEPKRLVNIYAQFSKGESYQPFSYPNYLDYRDWNTVFDGLLASYDVQFDLSDGDSAQSVAGQYVSENYFEVLGLRPIRGRFIYPKTKEDSEHADVAVISYGLWRSRFGGSADVIGTIIHLQGVQVTVIGVAPKDFAGLYSTHPSDIWIPLHMIERLERGNWLTERGTGWLDLTGRLKPGVSLAQVQSAMDVLADQLAATRPESGQAKKIRILPAGLFLRSLQKMEAVELGFQPKGVMTMRVALNPKQYDAARQRFFYHALLDRLKTLPGCESVSLGSAVPFGERISGWGGLRLEDSESAEESGDANVNKSAPGLFATLGIPLIQGRDFAESDRAGATKIAIINKAMADRYWPNKNPLGKRVFFDELAIEIVGVAGNARYGPLGGPEGPMLYLPCQQFEASDVVLVFRTKVDPKSLQPLIFQELHSLDSNLVRHNLVSLTDSIDRYLLPQRSSATTAGIIGLLALLLAAMGLCGSIAYSVSQRTREIGVRMALGAKPVHVLRLVVAQGMKPVAIGLIGGFVFGFWASRFLTSFLFGIGPSDWPTYVGVSLLFVATALLACFIPARRAAKVDPMEALRYA